MDPMLTFSPISVAMLSRARHEAAQAIRDAAGEEKDPAVIAALYRAASRVAQALSENEAKTAVQTAVPVARRFGDAPKADK